MTISVQQLATAINNCAHITPESTIPVSGMTTWEITILNQYCHIVDRSYHTGWYQEEAERIARENCSKMHEFTWQVIPIIHH